MDPMSRPKRPSHGWPLALATGLAIATLVACAPGSGLPVQPQGTQATGTADSTSSTPAATSSTGGSVVPEIRF